MIVENLKLKTWSFRQVEGSLQLPPGIFAEMLAAPIDVLPEFEGSPNMGTRTPRGKDHPRYGRMIYALARTLQPKLIVEVGTSAGGTAVAWAKYLHENGSGRLVCVDNNSYAKGVYPDVTERNLRRVGLASDRYELLSGDSRELVPRLAQDLKEQVDAYLVDGDHTYAGALADMEDGLPMLKQGGIMAVHDVDRGRRMREATTEHPYPVYEAFMDFTHKHDFNWCILKFIRKHLGIISVS
ncbi:class I SAM-dependent methyltransferase [Oligoflexia bacterium]|nr:class I SAM-dependent methyltransferase [Oligoflexia bacterium]